MNCLIFGASGFIGSNLKKRLINDGHQVFIGKVRNGLSYFDRYDIDYILYLSAYGNMFNQRDEMETIKANILGLYNTLNDTKDIKYKGFINFSSSSVMLAYETFYSATKGAGERIVKAFVNKYDKPVVNVRPFTVIGKGEQPDHLIPKLINSCIKGDQMPFIGEPVHDFIGIDDFCEAIITLLPHCEKSKGESVDIGKGYSVSNEEILDWVEAITNKKANIESVDTMRPYDNKKWVANTTIMNSIGWSPKQSLEDVIRSMV